MSSTHTPYSDMFLIPTALSFQLPSVLYDARPAAGPHASPGLRSQSRLLGRRLDRARLDRAEAEHEDVAAGDVRAAGLAALVLRRAHPDQLAEPGAERAQAAEPDQVAHLGHGQVRRPQQVGGALDPPPGQVLHRRLAVLGREASQEVVLRHPG